MADPKGFLKIKRKKSEYRPVCERVKDYKEVVVARSDEHSVEQVSRCMDCGTPFCHWGCPLGNFIPEWNDLVFSGHWERAVDMLHACSNFPEITGRICPALCEYACVLGVNDDPVTIRENELAIIEHAFASGYIKPNLPKRRSGKIVAVVGSGPAGLACADQLNKAGHSVVLFERDDNAGGVLRYGIPDFKLDKSIIDRRINLLRKEGIEFRFGINVGVDYSCSKLLKEFDAACLTGGSRIPRDLKIKGRELKGIHFAMDFLIQSNRRVAGEDIADDEIIDAKDKRVVVIGGGDTGADCVGVSNRQGAGCVVQIEVMPKPPEVRTHSSPWPNYPLLLKVSTSHEEGSRRHWSILTKEFAGESGKVKKLKCVRVEFSEKDENGRPVMREVAGSEFEIEADLVILAVGFLHPEHKGALEALGVDLDERGNVRADDNFMTSKKGVFTAGDMRRGQSLAVWAISEGRKAARAIDEYLMGTSNLPTM